MFTAVFQKSGEWWAAYVEEVPGVNTQGATLEEARENLREALTMVLEAVLPKSATPSIPQS
jgi:predicted RNase H-like HicB family nuclease